MRGLVVLLTLPALLVIACLAGCGSPDPQAKTLEERARWNVWILNWAQEPGGDINVATRISGPPNSPLAHLTIRIVLTDAAESTIAEHWQIYDLEQVPRGGPVDLTLRIPGPGRGVDGLAIDLVPEPTAEEAGRLVELSD